MANAKKKTEDSLLYHKREQRSERQKLKDLTFKQKISYFNDYYRNLLLVIIISCFVIIYLLYTIFSPKMINALNVVIINDTYNPAKKELLMNNLSKYLGLNTEKQELTFDDSYYLNFKDSASVTAPVQDKIAVLAYSKELDIIIADEETFEFYASSGYLDNLADQLPTNLYSHFSNSFYMAKQEEDTNQSAYGIYLDDSDIYHNLGGSNEKHILGIVANSKNKDNTIHFLRYLYELD